MAGASTVAFPSSDDSQIAPQPPSVSTRPPHLPFRRISLPTPPSLVHRESVVSVASFDSLPEEGPSSPSSVSFQQLQSQSSQHVIRTACSTSNMTGGQQYKRPKRPSTTARKSMAIGGRTNVDEAMEAKRRKVINEFYATERAYVDGLELIYSHFLTPIIASLDTPTPLLDRAVMTAVFSNFIDIWNLHRSFLSSLTSLLFRHNNASDDMDKGFSVPITSSVSLTTSIPLSPLLLSHFPYLSLYTPFITSFPTTLSTLSALITPSSSYTSNNPGNLEYSPHFAAFVKRQEADPRCGKLKLRDWLLTIVQRCPRYLLLLKDLISCTNPDDPERVQLENVKVLVGKITTSLNTSLQTHAQTLSLLALQRSTPNLPFQLISPGRILLKRGPLIQVERSETPHEREFLLFSDCLIWLVREEDERAQKGEKVWGAIGGIAGGLGLWHSGDKSKNASKTSIGAGEEKVATTSASTTPNTPVVAVAPRTAELKRPEMVRTRSKSDADLTILQAQAAANAKMIAAASDDTPSSVDVAASSANEGAASPVPEKSYSGPLPTASSMPVPQKRRSYAGAEPTPMGANGARQRTKSMVHNIPRLNKVKRHASSTDDGLGPTKDRWVYKGRAELVDLEVVVPVKLRRSRPTSTALVEGEQVSGDQEGEDEEDASERRWEVLSPGGSFVLYADTEQERDEWTSQIRKAKSQLLVSLNVTNPHSTLTSSSSTQHIRRTLQALPFLPDDDRLGTVDELAEFPIPGAKQKQKQKAKKKQGERRGRVEHWVPAIWIPDEKAEGCMRCGRSFGWRRRRHHCRLCGRCVCASCSERTFFISDPNAPSTDVSNNKPARACNACYETVFPLLDPNSEMLDEEGDMTNHGPNKSSMTNFPSWLSMPSLPLASLLYTPAPVDRENNVRNQEEPPSQPLQQPTVYDLDSDDDYSTRLMQKRVKPPPVANRPRSYHSILEDFGDKRLLEELVEEDDATTNTTTTTGSMETSSSLPLRREVSFIPSSIPSKTSSKRHTVVHFDGSSHSGQMLLADPKKTEDTVRRNKRFSMPAVSLQTTSVTTRTSGGGGGNSEESTRKSIEAPGAVNSADAVVHPMAGVSSGAGASTLVISVPGPGPATEGPATGLPKTKAKTPTSLIFGSRIHHHHLHFVGSDFVGSKLKGHMKKDKGDMKIDEDEQEEDVFMTPPQSPRGLRPDMGKGVAAGKLSELLKKKTSKSKVVG